jgi:hypothetical protein
MQTTEIRHQAASLEERLRDEFQVELAEVAASASPRGRIRSRGRRENGEAAGDARARRQRKPGGSDCPAVV